jgi:ATP-dependent RNA helicase RhlE
VAVTPVATTVESVEQRVIFAERVAKPSLLSQVLKADAVERALVFTRTKHGADRVVRSLGQSGITAKAIHGNKSQNERERVLAAFRDGHVRTLVATDIAARGIDVTGITHVINYDLPNIPKATSTASGGPLGPGQAGVAVSFCDGEEAPFLRDIEKLIRMSIPVSDASLRPGRPARRPPSSPSRQTRSARSAASRAAAGPPMGKQPNMRRQAAGGAHWLAASLPAASPWRPCRLPGCVATVTRRRGSAGWPTWPSCMDCRDIPAVKDYD